MLIPSIDLLNGQIVQLKQGQTEADGKPKLAFTDFDYWIDRFKSYPLVQLIDLDAAMRQGDNTALVQQISKRLPVQVGGGIRTLERARQVLAAGAQRVIIGSALFQEASGVATVNTAFAQQLAEALAPEFGPGRIVAGIDSRNGKIAIKGWQSQIDLTPDEAIPAVESFVGAFLYTHIDGEGLLGGFPLSVAQRLRPLTQLQLIVAGGIRHQSEIETLAAINVDAVAGMAVYTNLLPA